MATPVLTVTDAAAERIQSLIASAEEPVHGLRVGVTSYGCSGMGYKIEYAKDVQKYDEVVEDKGVKVFVDPMAIMYLIGSTMDYRDDRIQSGFVFENPNEKGRCGCGESFTV